MATTADIRNGMVFEHKGDLMKIISFLHVKPGKGGAFVRTKLKNVVTGQVMDVTFRSGEKLKEVRLESRQMQFLYANGESLIFMDTETFDQVQVPRDVVESETDLLKEGTVVDVESVGDRIIGVTLPVFVELEVSDAEPGVRGNTASGGSKPVMLESGLTVNVPLFVDVGDVLRIDTRTGEYVERVK
ncbi:MAG: elongation factor P [Fidelibacterota bacterium]